MPVTLRSGLVVTVEIGLCSATGTGYGIWDVGAWGSATWGPDDVWVDVSQWLRSLTTIRRFSREVQAWETGTAAVLLDNRDARFSPENLAGPYVVGGVTGIRPWRPIRIAVTWAGVTYPLYRGWVIAWKDAWTKAQAGRGDAAMALACVDEFARLAGVDGLARPAAGTGELFGRRLHRILDAAGHTGDRAIDLGTVTMQATTLAANSLTEAKLTADSEGGAVYVGAAGEVIGERQYALIENPRSNTVQALFGDSGDSGDELPYFDLDSTYDGDQVVNMAAYARVGGTSQTAADPASRSLYGDRRDTRTDLVCETDDQTTRLASWAVARRSEPELRFTSMTIKPLRDRDRLMPVVYGLRVRDLIQVRKRPAGGRLIDRYCYVAGIRHQIVPGGLTTVFDLTSATQYVAYATSRWDVGTWDDARWFY